MSNKFIKLHSEGSEFYQNADLISRISNVRGPITDYPQAKAMLYCFDGSLRYIDETAEVVVELITQRDEANIAIRTQFSIPDAERLS